MPPNVLGVYNPIFYAQEALIHLEKALGLAGRVHRGIDQERRSFGRGETISIRKPSTFTAEDAPSTAQNLNTGTVSLTLNKWKEVKFSLTDKELAFTSERIIQEHIRPAAYALADRVDQDLVTQFHNIPWFYDLAGTTEVGDITGPRQVLFDNAVPLSDPSLIHYMINGTLENEFLQLPAFSQQQGAGNVGVDTQLRGTLGIKFGSEVFANQNTPSHVKGTASTGTLAVKTTVAAGLSTITLDAVSVTGTLVPGDTFVIAGNTQRYAITNTTTAGTNEFVGVTFTPALVATATADDVVTVSLDNHVKNCMFHRNAFALATAPLSEMGNELGAKIASVTDPKSSLSLRSRLFYDGDASAVVVALDLLYGFTTLDPNFAVIGRG